MTNEREELDAPDGSDFVPFGDEWRREVNKLTKPQLIEWYRDALIENKTFRAAQKACEYCDGPTMGEVSELRDTLEWLVDLQNGCPLEKYRDKWEATMARANKILNRPNAPREPRA